MPFELPSGSAAQVVVILVVVTLAYVLQQGVGVALQAKVPHGAEEAQAQAVFRSRIAGGLILGLVPTLVALAQGTALGLAWPKAGPTMIFWSVVVLLVLPTVAASMHRSSAWSSYPPVRYLRWDRDRFLVNAGAWALYLFGYELCFRGVLLFGLAPVFGEWPALAVMTGLYVLAHVDKPMSEALGTLPMGFVFGLSALHSGSFLPAFIAHWVIAVTSDAAAIRANPELKWSGPA